MRTQRQLPVREQYRRMKDYIRLAKQNYNRAYREVSAIYRIRRGCPYEHALRYKRFDDATQHLRIAEQCLKELDHCYVLRVAGFRPGDQLLVTTTMKGFPRTQHRYIICDVVPSRRDSYYYEVQELTKTGDPHGGRYPTWISPSNRISIEYCTESLGERGAHLAESSRARTKRLLEDVLERGDLSAFLPKPPSRQTAPARQYPYWLRHS